MPVTLVILDTSIVLVTYLLLYVMLTRLRRSEEDRKEIRSAYHLISDHTGHNQCTAIYTLQLQVGLLR